MWLIVVDKETERLFQPWSSQKLKIKLKLGKKHQSQTHMHLHPPVYLHIINIYKLGAKAPECIHGSEICYLGPLSELISLSYFCDAAAVLPDPKEASFQAGQPISMYVTCSVPHRH